jgi:hypothetical protein
MKRIILISLSFVLCFSSCERLKKRAKSLFEENNPVVELNGEVLYFSEIEKNLPGKMSSEDSILFVENYIKRWAVRNLMYDKASVNVKNLDEIEQLVADYRKSLLIHQYQQKLIEQRLKNPTESEIKDYYDNNSEKFKLKENLIKGLYMKVPKNAPRIEELKSLMTDLSSEKLHEIEKYSYQNAVNYEYFGENWVNFDELLKKIPTEEKAENLFKQRFIELSDKEFIYLLYISKYKEAGSVEPFDFAKDKINVILRNINKNTYIHNFEDELYNQAQKKGELKFY